MKTIKKVRRRKNPLQHEDFPLASKYDHKWVVEDCFGANPLWLTEWLCKDLEITENMRILDLGCGRAKSSIFLAKEFGAEVWAADLWIDPTDNFNDIKDFDVAEKVFPMRVEADKLPFPFEFFDAVIAIDAIQYFGTDDLYLPYLVQFLKPKGKIAFASPGMTNEFSEGIPEHLELFWTSDYWCLHTVEWWKNHWGRTNLIDVQNTETMEDGWKLWAKWAKIGNSTDWYRKAIEEDAGKHLGFIKMIAEKSENAPHLAYNLQTGEWQ